MMKLILVLAFALALTVHGKYLQPSLFDNRNHLKSSAITMVYNEIVLDPKYMR